MKPRDKATCIQQWDHSAVELLAGMFAGLVTVGAITSCFGLADNLTEVATVMFLGLTAATLLYSTDRLLASTSNG